MEQDAVIIGGGIHGCCTALHLARKGCRPVVIEKDTVGRHASGVNAGGVRQLLRDPAEIPLSQAAMERWFRLDDLLGRELARQCAFIGGVGQVAVAETDADMAALEQRAAEVAKLGYRHEELIDRRELRRLLPSLSDHCVGGLVSRRDGHASPYPTTQAFRRRAEALGVRILEHTRVTALEPAARGWRVVTTAGSFPGEIVVNCGGAWGWQVAAMAGERLPRDHFASSMMVSARMPKFVDPVVIGTGRPLSFKQTEAGTVVIGGGILGIPDLEGGTAATVMDRLAASARTVFDLFPIMRQATIVRTWAGLEAVMPDKIPVIGASTRAPGLWHAFGFSGHGFQLGPIVGSLLADLIIDGSSPLPIAPFRPGRFDAQEPRASWPKRLASS